MSLFQMFRQVWQRRQPTSTQGSDDRDRSSMADLVRALQRADLEDAQRSERR